MVVPGSPPIPRTTAVMSAGLSLVGRSGRYFGLIGDFLNPITRFLTFILLSCIGLQIAGLNFAGEKTTQAMCVALLLLGLPHGTFDWQLLRAGLNQSIHTFAFRIGLYLALAAATYLVWQLAPTAALAIFLLIAVVHFAEDWGGDGILANPTAIKPEFLALAMPMSIITLPALSHPEMLRSIFVMLSGDASSAVLVDAMILLAPVATGIATAKIVMDITTGELSRGVAGLCVLAAMVVLPPIAGFSLYFCLYHSPIHFKAGWSELTTGDARYPALITTGLSIGGLVLASMVYIFGQRVAVTDSLVVTTFLTLSMLTVPHMLVPSIIGWSREPVR